MLSLRNIKSIWRLKVIASHDIVDVADTSWSHSDFSKVHGPDTSIGILRLILGQVGCVDVIMNVSEFSKRYLSLSSHS